MVQIPVELCKVPVAAIIPLVPRTEAVAVGLRTVKDVLLPGFAFTSIFNLPVERFISVS